MTTNETTMTGHTVISREEWIAARKALLTKDKQSTRLRGPLAAERRALPWVKIDKEYVFDGPEGKGTLADLFDGRSQRFIQHFMMAPRQVGQCVGCSLEVAHVVFNYGFAVSFTPEQIEAGRACYNYEYENPWLEERSGDSVFFEEEAGEIFHTYSTFGRGGEEFLGIYRYFKAIRGERRRKQWERIRNQPTSKRSSTCTCMTCAARPGCARHAIGSSRTTSWTLSTTPCASRRLERKGARLREW